VRAVTEKGILCFRKTVLDYFTTHGRSFPWRETTDPYAILVSEIMLQQTQTARVADYFPRFMRQFPTIESLAAAPLRAVLSLWQGLGYNRRALFLKRCAEALVERYRGVFPQTIGDLISLPGIGPYTARAVLVFAFNQPHVIIETNIRAVFLHHFFPRRDNVPDREITPLVEKTLDRGNPRQWFFALMDYGSHLKEIYRNPSRRSAHHTVQPPFEGSNRQLRGAILRCLAAGPLSRKALVKVVADDLGKETREMKRLSLALSSLCRDNLIQKKGGFYSLSD